MVTRSSVFSSRTVFQIVQAIVWRPSSWSWIFTAGASLYPLRQQDECVAPVRPFGVAPGVLTSHFRTRLALCRNSGGDFLCGAIFMHIPNAHALGPEPALFVGLRVNL